MSSDLKKEDTECQLRVLLNKENIKLWLQPYYSEDHGVGPDEEQALQLLSEQITELMNIGQEYCISVLKELQTRALTNQQSNEVFKKTGVATLKVKISGKNPMMVNIDMPLSSYAGILIKKIAERINVKNDRIKLIAHGRVLEPFITLATQGVKHGSPLMAVVMEEEAKLQKEEEQLKTLESTKDDLKLLTDPRTSNGERYFQIENQYGEALNIPPKEHKALVTAMALHEKGRAALKKDNYALALVLFLEADKNFSDCRSELLNACDNYAVLHLDIAWCYLCLRNPVQIPDAEYRLSLCEKNFHRSYGENMERLMTIKGTTGNEMSLFMRLHLLQGVVHFHQNRRAEAKKLFERAQAELNILKVDDNSMTLLMELGYSSSEARLGLRDTFGNVNAAAELINRRRKERKEAHEQNILKRKLERERKALGLCEDGKQYCDPSLVSQLQIMGFDHQVSVAALKLANNIVTDAISIINDTPHRLVPSPVSEESIEKIASLGFDAQEIRHLLERSPQLKTMIKSLPSRVDSSGASCSTADNQMTTSASSVINFIEELRKKTEMENKAFERISEDLIDHDLAEDHLDVKLEQEEQFLLEYMSLLN